jgi:hypothetical protein
MGTSWDTAAITDTTAGGRWNAGGLFFSQAPKTKAERKTTTSIRKGKGRVFI